MVCLGLNKSGDTLLLQTLKNGEGFAPNPSGQTEITVDHFEYFPFHSVQK